MKITNVKVYPQKQGKKSSLLAFASITVDKVLVINGFRIIDGKRGSFVAVPSQKGSDGEYYDQVYGLDKDTQEMISDAILAAYEDEDEDEKPAKKSGKKSGKNAGKKSGKKSGKRNEGFITDDDDDEDDDDDDEDD